MADFTIADALKSRGAVTLYGRAVSGIDDASQIIAVEPVKGIDGKISTPPATLALIRAFSWGSYCRPLPIPILLILPGAGEELKQDDKCGRKGETFWTTGSNSDIAHVAITNGAAFELLGDIESRGIDGGIGIENPRFDGSRLCATIHFWGKIEVFGASASIDERVPVCIPLEGCHTVWDAGIARVEVCFRAPSSLCAKVCVGKWGLEKCWDACVNIPLLQGSPTPAPKECGCH
ncbi:hypothetical protein sos41_04820 [Alphaproteobacteria bacterium SO-S41]|nr:hypothetical protein sos41_04820 [Alphaproteobacteria bacterium SO-S41]